MLHRPLLTVILGLLFNPLFSESATADARFGVQNCTAEWRFRANQSHIDPFQVDLDVIITDPQQRTERVPAFWAGDLDWKVRYCPHTTGAITVNENADPDVVHDLMLWYNRIVPKEQPGFRHGEGNSDSHIKLASAGS